MPFQEPTLKTPWKLAVIGFGSILFLISFVAVGFVIAKSEYKPFKAKQPKVIMLALIAAFMWWIGALQSVGIIDQDGIFANCAIFSVWMQLILGADFLLSVLSFRLLRLYYILVKSQTPGGLVFYSIIFSFQVPIILLGFSLFIYPGVYLSVNPTVIKANPTGDKACDFSNFGYLVSLYAFILLHVLFLVVLNLFISRIRSAFNEFRENKIALYLVIANLVISLVATVGFGIQNRTAGKIFLNMMQLLSTLSLVWITIFPPLLGYLRNPGEYLIRWKRGLRDEHLPTQLMYGVNQETSSNGQESISGTVARMLSRSKSDKESSYSSTIPLHQFRE